MTDHSAGVRQRTCQTCGATQREETYPEGTLRLYDVGSDVKKLQWALYHLGYLSASQIDGGYGPRTEAAVQEFQENNGLPADGIAAGPVSPAGWSLDLCSDGRPVKHLSGEDDATLPGNAFSSLIDLCLSFAENRSAGQRIPLSPEPMF